MKLAVCVALAAALNGLQVEAAPGAAPSFISTESPYFKGLMGAHPPEAIEDMLFVHDVLRIAQQDAKAERVYRWAEWRVLGAASEQPPGGLPATLAELVAADIPTELDRLRLDVRRRAIVPVRDEPRRSPMEQTFRNYAAIPVTGFEVVLGGSDPSAYMLCQYDGGALRPRETVPVNCVPHAMTQPLGGTYAIAWVRFEPGAYLNRGRSGMFADRHAETAARLAAVPTEQFERPRFVRDERKLQDAAAEGERWTNIVSWGLVALGLAIGWVIGARATRPLKAAALFSIATALMVVAGGVAVVLAIAAHGPYVDMAGFLLLLLGILATAGAILALAVWLSLNAGLWVGVFIGRRRRDTRGPIEAGIKVE